jgi:hypothetical protein
MLGRRPTYRLDRGENILEATQYIVERVESSFSLAGVASQGLQPVNTGPLLLHDPPSPFDLIVDTPWIAIPQSNR